MIWRFNGVKALPFDTRKLCSGRDLNLISHEGKVESAGTALSK